MKHEEKGEGGEGSVTRRIVNSYGVIFNGTSII
jgi:hypothetical protein